MLYQQSEKKDEKKNSLQETLRKAIQAKIKITSISSIGITLKLNCLSKYFYTRVYFIYGKEHFAIGEQETMHCTRSRVHALHEKEARKVSKPRRRSRAWRAPPRGAPCSRAGGSSRARASARRTGCRARRCPSRWRSSRASCGSSAPAVSSPSQSPTTAQFGKDFVNQVSANRNCTELTRTALLFNHYYAPATSTRTHAAAGTGCTSQQ